MSTQTFYPVEAGLTKADIISTICDRRAEAFANIDELGEGEWVNIGFPEMSLLTDELMQKYVDDCHTVQERVFKFEHVDIGDMLDKQEQVLKDLARKITS